MTNEDEPKIDYVALSSALSGHIASKRLDPATFEAFKAIGAVGQPAPSEHDVAADKYWWGVRRFQLDVAADMKKLGIDPESPEAHDYFVKLAALRPAEAAKAKPKGRKP